MSHDILLVSNSSIVHFQLNNGAFPMSTISKMVKEFSVTSNQPFFAHPLFPVDLFPKIDML
jgi:hypothetical protein